MAEWAPELPQLLTGAVMLALAAVLLYLNVHNRANRVFAFLLFLRGLLSITRSIGLALEEGPVALVWHGLTPYLLFPLPFVALYFALVYPTPRGPIHRHRALGLFFAAASLVLMALYAWRPTLFWDLGAGATDTIGPEVSAPAGPLFVFDVLFEATYALLAILFARDYVRAAPEAPRVSSLLMSYAFAAVVLYDSLSIPLVASQLLWRHGAALSALMTATLALAVALVLGLAAWLAAQALHHSMARVRQGIKRYLLLLALPILSILLVPVASGETDLTTVVWTKLLAGLWRLALPLVVTYALVRHQLFDIDLRVKHTLRNLALVAPFAIAFFVASEVLEEFVPVEGFLLGLAAAAAIALALRPLQHFSEALADRLMPGVRESPDYLHARKLEVYRETLELLLADGMLTPEEAEALARLRARLGIPESEARRLEGDVRDVVARGRPL